MMPSPTETAISKVSRPFFTLSGRSARQWTNGRISTVLRRPSRSRVISMQGCAISASTTASISADASSGGQVQTTSYSARSKRWRSSRAPASGTSSQETMRIPGGRTAFRRPAISSAGSAAVSSRVAGSAAPVTPVLSAEANANRSRGLKPAEKATGSPARRIARSNVRSMSRWPSQRTDSPFSNVRRYFGIQYVHRRRDLLKDRRLRPEISDRSALLGRRGVLLMRLRELGLLFLGAELGKGRGAAATAEVGAIAAEDDALVSVVRDRLAGHRAVPDIHDLVGSRLGGLGRLLAGLGRRGQRQRAADHRRQSEKSNRLTHSDVLLASEEASYHVR